MEKKNENNIEDFVPYFDEDLFVNLKDNIPITNNKIH